MSFTVTAKPRTKSSAQDGQPEAGVLAPMWRNPIRQLGHGWGPVLSVHSSAQLPPHAGAEHPLHLWSGSLMGVYGASPGLYGSYA